MIYFIITKVVPISIIWPKSIISVCVYFTGDSNNAFVLPTPTWFPFDWKNPAGYCVAVILEYLMTICISYFVGSLAILGISTYILMLAMIKDIKYRLYSINENAKADKNKNPTATVEQFSDFIQMHSMTKQLSILLQL